MVFILPLAVAIAAEFRMAAEEHASVEVKERADRLFHGHPELSSPAKRESKR
jgi:hypothetical protein